MKYNKDTATTWNKIEIDNIATPSYDHMHTTPVRYYRPNYIVLGWYWFKMS
jgi:hypothetical protein